jgi:hypothetical protein
MLTACLSGGTDYGKTITDHLMSKVPTGYKVEILRLEKLAPVTVADSITILRSEFENDRNGKVEHTRGVMALARMLPESPNRQNREKALYHTIDSLESLLVPRFYENVSTNKVLAVPVRCRYSVFVPGAPSAVTETFDFWLTPDGRRVIYQRKSK